MNIDHPQDDIYLGYGEAQWQASCHASHLRPSRRFHTRCETAKAQHQHREINSRCLRWSAYLSRPGSIKLACPMIKIELEPTSQKRVLRGAAIQRRGIPAGSVMREGTWSTVCPRHSRCATLALTDNKETGVERFLCYDVVPDLHRLRSCTHYHDVRETLDGKANPRTTYRTG